MRAAIIGRLQSDYQNPAIELRSVGAHGKQAGLTVIARVEFRVNGRASTNRESIRYYRLYHNRAQQSWQVIGDTGGWAYYSMWLP